MTGIEITATGRGLHVYGKPVTTSYGEEVSVQESSAATAPHVWLTVKDADHGDRRGTSVAVHLNREQALATIARLQAWVDEIPTRWAGQSAEEQPEKSPVTPWTGRMPRKDTLDDVQQTILRYVDALTDPVTTDQLLNLASINSATIITLAEVLKTLLPSED